MTSASSMSLLNVDTHLSGTRIDMEGGGGPGVIHGVPPPPPVPPSPLVPSVAQGMGNPTGGGAHGGGDLPGTNSAPPLPKDLRPLPGCVDPHWCVGGLHVAKFSGPGGGVPRRGIVEWVTMRVNHQWRGMPWYGGSVPPPAECVWGDLLEDQVWSAETWRTHIVEPTLLRPPSKCQVAKEVNCKLVLRIF